MSKFPNIEYKGGHPEMTTPCTVTVHVDAFDKCVRLIKNSWIEQKPAIIDYDEILNVSLDDKSKRSLGKAAAGAIIGGVLTGGIGLIAGGLFGGRNKNTSVVYITIAPNGKEKNIILKAGKQADSLYAEISALI